VAAGSGVKGGSLEMTGQSRVLILSSEGSRSTDRIGGACSAECHEMEYEKLEIRFD
jgi:hypothetical protein